MGDHGFNDMIQYSVILSNYKQYLRYHRDVPGKPYWYRNFSQFKRVITNYAFRIDAVYTRVKELSGHILVENVPMHLKGHRVVLEGFINGLFDLLSFLGKVRLMPFNVRAPINRANGQKFSRRLRKMINKM